MISRIHENADGRPGPDVDCILDDADGRIVRLKHERAAIAERRRALVEPAFKTVVANPSEMHHKIALGAVMVNVGLASGDADALAGMLAVNAAQIFADLNEMLEEDPLTSFGRVLVAAIDRYGRELTARGLFETWCRRLAVYAEDRAEWLARDAEFRLEGAWRQASMTKDQQWLMRTTCRTRRIDLPGDLTCGEAADWLEDHGANMTYREFLR